MYQTQLMQVTHKAILHAIRRQLLILAKGKEILTYTSNNNFEQKSLINRTLTVVVLITKARIEYRIAPIGGASLKILTPATKEVVVDTVSGDTWVNRTLWQVSPTGVDRITLGDISHSLLSKLFTSPVIIVMVTTSTPYGLRGTYRLQINNNSLAQNWTLLLIENFPMIGILRPFSAR